MTISPLTYEELKLMMESNSSLQLVDVRSTNTDDKKDGYIPNAVLMPFEDLLYAFRVLNPREDVVFVCQDGVRSLDSCYFLEAQGFDRLFYLKDGIVSWQGSLYNKEECKKNV